MISLSLGLIGLRIICQIMHPKNLIFVKSNTMKLLFLVAIIHILFISTNPAAGLLNLTKNASTDVAYFGDIVTYDYVLTNEEGVNLHDVVFTDDHLGSIAIGNLDRGKNWTHSIIHTINVSDMPGPLKNNAWATGKRPDESVVTSPIATFYVGLNLAGSLYVDINPHVGSRGVGQTVTYTISVTNNYPVTIYNMSINNTLYHPSAIVRWVGLTPLNLTPGQKATGTLSYTVVQQDILGPPPGIPGSGTPFIYDVADATGRFPWWNPLFPNTHTVAGGAVNTIGVTYTTQQVVSKTANVTQGTLNTRTTFNITVRNGGTALLNKTELTDLLPKGLTFISASPVVTSSIPNLNGTTTLRWSNLSQSFGRVLDPGKQFNPHSAFHSIP